jgi:acyl carrier protein
MTTTFNQLSALLIKDYKIPLESLTLDAPFESLGIDSLGMAELMFYIEDEFKVKLPHEPVELPTIGHVVRYIDELIAYQSGKISINVSEESATHAS